MTATLPDVITFALELPGAFLHFRQRNWSLAFMLTCAALGNGAQFFLTGDAYGYVWWAAEALNYLCLSVIACQAMAKMAAHHGRISFYACAVIGIVGAVAGWASAQGETLPDHYLDAEIGAGVALVGAVAIACLFRKKFLEAPWTWITLGVVVAAGGDILCAMLWKVWAGAPQVYCVPAILSLLIWNWAGAAEEEKARRFRELARAA